MLDDDAVQDVGDVVEAVHHLFKVVVNLVADVKLETALADIGPVELAQTGVVQLVGLAFE